MLFRSPREVAPMLSEAGASNRVVRQLAAEAASSRAQQAAGAMHDEDEGQASGSSGPGVIDLIVRAQQALDDAVAQVHHREQHVGSCMEQLEQKITDLQERLNRVAAGNDSTEESQAAIVEMKEGIGVVDANMHALLETLGVLNIAVAAQQASHSITSQHMTVANTARDEANASLLEVTGARDAANASLLEANASLLEANAARDAANASLLEANAARDAATASLLEANAARDEANASLLEATGARDAANASVLEANAARDAGTAARDAATFARDIAMAERDASEKKFTDLQDAVNQAKEEEDTAKDRQEAQNEEVLSRLEAGNAVVARITTEIAAERAVHLASSQQLTAAIAARDAAMADRDAAIAARDAATTAQGVVQGRLNVINANMRAMMGLPAEEPVAAASGQGGVGGVGI